MSSQQAAIHDRKLNLPAYHNTRVKIGFVSYCCRALVYVLITRIELQIPIFPLPLGHVVYQLVLRGNETDNGDLYCLLKFFLMNNSLFKMFYPSCTDTVFQGMSRTIS